MKPVRRLGSKPCIIRGRFKALGFFGMKSESGLLLVGPQRVRFPKAGVFQQAATNIDSPLNVP